MITPFGNRIIVRPDKPETTTASGLYIPETSKQKAITGLVIAVGRGKYIDGTLVQPEAQIGDRIIINQYSGTEYKVDDEVIIIIDDSDILAKF